jgi:MarR family 2-MHQ and catechol resistance regulon transcriptional repressor
VRTDRREQLYDNVLRRATASRQPFDQAAVRASLNLALTYDVQQSFLWKTLNALGLARSSFNVMTLLRFAYPEGVQLSEIGELLITSRANITGLIDHLEQKGYVKRAVDAHDRRARLAKLTKKGEILIDQIMPAHVARSISLFSHLTLDEVEQLTALLTKIRQNPVIAQAGADESVALHPVFSNED